MAHNDIGRVTPIWRGFYSAAATYELNDIVIDASGSIWWHKSPEVTTGITPAAGAIWAVVIDMGVFSGLIADAIAQARAALEAAEGAVSEVTADTERAETAAENAEASALSASESAASVGAYAQAAEDAKNAAQTAASQAAASASSAGVSATSAGSSAQAAETAKTAAQTAATQAAGSAETASGAAAVVEQKKAEAIAAIEDKGEEVLASIPEDYTELSNEVNEAKESTSELNRAVFGGYHDTGVWSRGAFEAYGYSALSSLQYVHSEIKPAGSYVITPASGFYFEVYTYVSDTVGTKVYGMSGNTLSFTADAPFIITSRKNPSADISAQELENYNEFIDIYHVLSQTSISEDVSNLKTSSAGLTKGEILMDGLLFFYKQQRPTITKSGTDFIVTIPENPRGFYTKSGKLYPLTSSGTTGTITVPTSSYLVYNITDTAFEVMTYQQINASADELILAFGNNNGYLYGQWERFHLEDEVTKAIAESKAYADELVGNGTLPAYYYANNYLPQKLATIRGLVADAGSAGVSFAFISDIHYDAQKQNNMRMSPALLREISQKTPVKRMICGGDMITSASGSKDAGLALEQETITDFRTKTQMDTFWTIGNHEYNNPGNDPALVGQQLTVSEVYPFITQDNFDSITLSNDTGAYYADDFKNKVRFLFAACNLDSNVNEDSITWLIEQLPDTPTDYDIVLISHLGIYYNPTSAAYTGPVDAFKPILQALQAYKAHSTFTYDGSTYDFAQKNGTVLGAFLGHYHVDGSGTWHGIPCVIITTDSLNQRAGTLTREAGTITEQAFDVVTIDRSAKVIHCTRIGAGEDRSIQYT